MVVTGQLDKPTECMQIIVDIISFKMILDSKHQIYIPIPKADILEEFSKLKCFLGSHGIKSILNVVLNEGAKIIVTIEYSFFCEHFA